MLVNVESKNILSNKEYYAKLAKSWLADAHYHDVSGWYHLKRVCVEQANEYQRISDLSE